jgi:putative AlgH/UPF0301 family transcriptional regulator
MTNPVKILYKGSLRLGKEIEKYPALTYFFLTQCDSKGYLPPSVKQKFRDETFSLSKNFEQYKLISNQLSMCKKDIPWYEEFKLNSFPTYRKNVIEEVTPGCLLIAHPLNIGIKDTIFHKTVTLILHSDESSIFGVIINSLHDNNNNNNSSNYGNEGNIREIPITSLSSSSSQESDIYWQGGPVPHISFILFTKKDLYPNSFEVCPGLYYASVVGAKTLEGIPKSDYRFFKGFSVWTRGQLKRELQERNDWIIAKSPMSLIFPGKNENEISFEQQPTLDRDGTWNAILKAHWVSVNSSGGGSSNMTSQNTDQTSNDENIPNGRINTELE